MYYSTIIMGNGTYEKFLRILTPSKQIASIRGFEAVGIEVGFGMNLVSKQN